jgi:hypothetical protein
MLKKLPLLALATALGLWAADFWVSKPYTEWSEKEIQKMVTDSPWTAKTSVDVTAPPARGGAADAGTPGRGGRGGARSGPQGDAINSDPGIDGGGGGGFGGGGIGGPAGPGAGAGGAGGGAGGMSAPVVIRWQSALPVKQAMMKSRYGNEVSTSAEAKKVLEREEQFYIIYLGTSPMAARGLQGRKDALLQSTSLNVKGKPPIKPTDIQFSPPQPGQPQAPAEAYFLFPRTAPLTLEDKEVEFVTKINSSNVKSKFKLKDMVLNGKLEL